MGYKKLISPEFRVTVGDYEVTDGIEVECFSSKESHMDWCRVELSPQLQGVLKFKDMDEASVELGYEDDFDSLIDGYVRCGDTDYWKERRQGKAEEKKASRVEFILRVLEIKGTVDEKIRKRIEEEQDVDLLDNWLTNALKANTVQEFEQELN